jgi:glycerate dehydrogenase
MRTSKDYLLEIEIMNIVVLDGYALNPGDLSWDGLKRLGNVKVYDRTPLDSVYDRSESAEIILTNKTIISGDMLGKLPQLKYIGVLATGYNVVDTEEARRHGIIVTNIPAYSTDSVAQLTFALILEFCFHPQKHSDSVMNGKWSESADFTFRDYPLTELSSKTLGIIGFGNIGNKVYEIGSAFGMNIIVFSTTRKDKQGKNPRWVELNELFSESDFITIHCPLTPETKNLVNRERLAIMKKSAILINTSRGPVVSEHDLAAALNNGVIAGAGLDVLTIEPPSADNPLFHARNCIITPHIAWATFEARTRLMGIAVRNVESFIGGQPLNVVN